MAITLDTRRLCRHVRPDHRRPGPARRHRAVHRGREGFHHLRRGSEVRRRQGHPRRHGPEPGHRRAGRGRHRHHQRADPRSLGHRQGRHRHQGRPHRRASARPATPTSSPASTIVIGPGTEVIAGEGKIVTAGGFDTHIHFICPQQIEEALMSRRHHDARRRHRPGDRHQRHHLHARARGTSARMLAGGRRLPDEPRLCRQGQRRAAGRAGGDDRGRRLRAEAARGLGHDAGRHRLLPRGRRRATTCR